MHEPICCTPKFLPVVPGQERIALLAGKYWGEKGVDLSVSFMERVSPEFSRKLFEFANKLGSRGANIRFRPTNGVGDIRIAFGPGGYWSYLGTDCRNIPQGEPTMNLQDFQVKTPDAEWDRVVPHEFGHAIGCPHEHMRRDIIARLDQGRTIAYFTRTQGWSASEVRQQVLTPLEERSLLAGPIEQTSIMCYQIPGECTRDGRPIAGGSRITEGDFAFLGRVYPGKAVPPSPPDPSGFETIVITGRNLQVTKGGES